LITPLPLLCPLTEPFPSPFFRFKQGTLAVFRFPLSRRFCMRSSQSTFSPSRIYHFQFSSAVLVSPGPPRFRRSALPFLPPPSSFNKERVRFFGPLSFGRHSVPFMRGLSLTPVSPTPRVPLETPQCPLLLFAVPLSMSSTSRFFIRESRPRSSPLFFAAALPEKPVMDANFSCLTRVTPFLSPSSVITETGPPASKAFLVVLFWQQVSVTLSTFSS